MRCMWTTIAFASDLYLHHKNVEANEANRKEENWKIYLGQIQIDVYVKAYSFRHVPLPSPLMPPDPV